MILEKNKKIEELQSNLKNTQNEKYKQDLTQSQQLTENSRIVSQLETDLNHALQ